jgi:hypothetical protein
MPRKLLIIASLMVAVVGYCLPAAEPPAAVSVTTSDGRVWQYVPAPATAPTTAPAAPATQTTTPPASRPADPPIATRPALAALVNMVAPAGEVRPDGVTLSAVHTDLRHARVVGWRQNVTAQHVRGTVTIEDVFSINPYRADKSETFVGQCLYADDLDALIVREFYGHGAGWQPDKPATDKNGYRHIDYINYGVKSFLMEDSWLDEPACAGVQVRGAKSIIRRCLITRAAVAILAVMGDVTIEDCTVYDGRPFWTPGTPASWTGDVGLQAYTTVKARNVWIVGHPKQAAAMSLVPGLKTYHLGAVQGSARYSGSTEWKPAIGPDGKPVTDLITADGCRIAGWPGPAFSGDRKDTGSGWTIAGGPVDVWTQLETVRSDMLARKISVADAVAAGQAIVRGAVR